MEGDRKNCQNHRRWSQCCWLTDLISTLCFDLCLYSTLTNATISCLSILMMMTGRRNSDWSQCQQPAMYVTETFFPEPRAAKQWSSFQQSNSWQSTAVHGTSPLKRSMEMATEHIKEGRAHFWHKAKVTIQAEASWLGARHYKMKFISGLSIASHIVSAGSS